MPDYLPLHKPGRGITRRASADITGGQVVEVSGTNTVAPAAANSVKWVGVAGHDAKTGEDVLIHKGGVQRPIASGSVAIGDAVACAAAGKVSTSATPTSAQFVGVALSAAADGVAVEVDMIR